MKKWGKYLLLLSLVAIQADNIFIHATRGNMARTFQTDSLFTALSNNDIQVELRQGDHVKQAIGSRSNNSLSNVIINTNTYNKNQPIIVTIQDI
jgi:hypothetical protein